MKKHKDISLCDKCHCMTHTIKGRCGKCKVLKVVILDNNPLSRKKHKIKTWIGKEIPRRKKIR